MVPCRPPVPPLDPALEAALDGIDFPAAAAGLKGVVRRTPLAPFPSGDLRVELRLKLESLQETGSFKARGAWNQIRQLDDECRTQGVTATSSGNHGRALAWAARRAGVPAAIFMPEDAYPNKVAACREEGAEVVLCPTRKAAEEACRRRVRDGMRLIHPYESARTVEGAGTTGLEIAEDWPEVEVVVVPVGGGGLISGIALALQRETGGRVAVLGVEPEGSATLARGLEAGKPVALEEITTRVQGLCPLSTGRINIAIARAAVRQVLALPDGPIFAAQARLVREGRLIVEPAGAAAAALVFTGGLPEDLLEERSPGNPLRVAAVVSGGNPDPGQICDLLGILGGRENGGGKRKKK